MLKSITLVTLLALGTIATPAVADYEFDSSGAPVNMHLVPPPVELNDIYASVQRPHFRAVKPFTAEEKALFERTTIPTDSY